MVEMTPKHGRRGRDIARKRKRRRRDVSDLKRVMLTLIDIVDDIGVDAAKSLVRSMPQKSFDTQTEKV